MDVHLAEEGCAARGILQQLEELAALSSRLGVCVCGLFVLGLCR